MGTNERYSLLSQVDEENEEIRAQAQVWKHMYGFADTIMLRCALRLQLPDLIHKYGPMTLTELASKLPLKSINLDRFSHIMRYLEHMTLFSVDMEKACDQRKYALTRASELLMKTHKKSLASFAMLQTHPLELSIWGHFIENLDEAKRYTEVYHDMDHDEEFNKLVNEAMTSHTKCMVSALVMGLMKERILDYITSLVDVGGSEGIASKAIIDVASHVKCIIMDLAHVIDSVPKDPRLDFLAGDMFAFVPQTDAILLKSVLHNYDDDHCLKILSKCKEAIPATKGKVIIVETIVDTENLPEFSSARLGLDMEMLCMGGKERTKKEWECLLHKAGFSYHKIIPIMAIESIIVAYP